jgi:hypothetical protein
MRASHILCVSYVLVVMVTSTAVFSGKYTLRYNKQLKVEHIRHITQNKTRWMKSKAKINAWCALRILHGVARE